MPFCMPALAQNETFEVPVNGTGEKERFYVNWEDGFFGQIELIDPDKPELGDEMILQNPYYLTYLQNEFNKQTVSMAERLQTVQQNMEIASDNLTKLAEANVNYLDTYLTRIEAINSQYVNLLTLYESMGTDIENRLRAMAKKPRKRPSTFYPNIASIVTDWDYCVFMVKFTEDYITDVFNETMEAAARLDEETATGDELVDIYVSIVETATQTAATLADYYEKNYDSLSYDNLLELHGMVVDNIESIRSYIENIDKNPTEEATALIQQTLQTLADTKKEFDEAVQEVNNLYASLSALPGLEAVLYSGVEGEPSGLAFNIIDNNGMLSIPASQSYAGVTYPVTCIGGNIFTQYYDKENPYCDKIVIPSSISEIGNEAFAVSGIKTVVVECPASVSEETPYLTDNSFVADVYENAVLFVPDGSENAYAAAQGWKNFKNIQPVSQASVDEWTLDNLSVTVSEDMLVINGAEGKSASVFTTDGMKIYEGTDSRIALPASGIYIVRIGKATFKIAR